MQDLVIQWFIDNWIQVIATIISIGNIYFFIHEKAIGWLISLISSLLFMYVYYKNQFYAFMFLQLYYISISIYGLFYWLKGKNKANNKLIIKHIQSRELLLLIIIGAILILTIYYILQHYTNSQVPLGDAIISGISIIAVYMLLRKYIENWFLWMINDAIAIVIFVKQKIYGAALLFIIYFIFSFVAYKNWRKNLYKNMKRVAYDS